MRKVVFISSITSDIGVALAKRYSQDGYIVAGTYRSKGLLPELTCLPDCHLFFCDLNDRSSIHESTREFASLGILWDVFISLAACPPPLNGFFSANFEDWQNSIHLNSIEQLRVLHSLYPYRQTKNLSHAVFFAGPGTNNAVKDFSALTISKIMLIKMCELLDAENNDMNVFIVGPGWTRTKTHQQIISDPNVSPEKYNETMQFLQGQEGTNMEDIYQCIIWLCNQGREVAGGRNFSVVHDCWGTEELTFELKNDVNMYKLRRFRNIWKEREKKYDGC